MVDLINPSRSPSPKPNSTHSSAIVAGRFVVSDATSEETIPTASSPSRSITSCCKRRIAGRFIVVDEDTSMPNQYNQQSSRFEILDLPVVPEGREPMDEPLSSLLRGLSDRVLAVEQENRRLKSENEGLRAELMRMHSQIGQQHVDHTAAKDLTDILLFS